MDKSSKNNKREKVPIKNFVLNVSGKVKSRKMFQWSLFSFYCMFDFEIKGISEAINQIVHDESLPAKPGWRYLIYRTGLSHTKLCIGKWERRGPVR